MLVLLHRFSLLIGREFSLLASFRGSKLPTSSLDSLNDDISAAVNFFYDSSVLTSSGAFNFSSIQFGYWNYRVRTCPTPHNLLLQCNQPLLWHTTAIVSLTYCTPCYYTCYNCSSNPTTNCTACSATDYRYLSSSGSCLCMSGYYEKWCCYLRDLWLHLCDLHKFIVMYFMFIHNFSKSNFWSMPMRFWLSWYWIFYLHFLCCIYWCSILCYMHAIFYVRNDVEYDRVLVLHMLACPSMPDLFGRVLPQWIILCSLCSILLNITSPVSCTSCAPTFIIMNGMCICDIGFYASPVLNICMLCSSSMVGCLECINEIQCTACDLSNYFML